jgi:glycosyltransferase involved in cell wall biosynthesis
LALWRRHPEWPLLTVLQNPRTARPGASVANIDHRVGYVPDDEVRHLQNTHLFHLCPSETEGFGHYLMEAMSTAAVTITTDAAPMNELVTPDRGLLVACASHGRQNLATTCYFDESAMERAIERAITMPDEECAMLGTRARAFYERNDRDFRERLAAAVLAAR